MKDNGKVALMTLALSEFFNGALQVKTPFLYLLFEYYTDGKYKVFGDATDTTNMMGMIP
jgi:glucose-6-phosphate-specific signal transduction histidine kinase